MMDALMIDAIIIDRIYVCSTRDFPRGTRVAL